MKTSLLFGSSLALFLSSVAAQETVCGEERFGEFSDSRVCESPA